MEGWQAEPDGVVFLLFFYLFLQPSACPSGGAVNSPLLKGWHRQVTGWSFFHFSSPPRRGRGVAKLRGGHSFIFLSFLAFIFLSFPSAFSTSALRLFFWGVAGKAAGWSIFSYFFLFLLQSCVNYMKWMDIYFMIVEIFFYFFKKFSL